MQHSSAIKFSHLVSYIVLQFARKTTASWLYPWPIKPHISHCCGFPRKKVHAHIVEQQKKKCTHTYLNEVVLS